MSEIGAYLVLGIFLLVGAVAGQNDISSDDGSKTTTTPAAAAEPTLSFAYPMKNYSRSAGDALKLKCEVSGAKPAGRFRWFKNEAPLHEEKGRIKIKEKTGGSADETQWSRVRFRDLEVMDSGFYRCEASNGVDTVKAESMLKVHMASKFGGGQDDHWGGGGSADYEDDYGEHGLIPEEFPLDFSGHLLQNGIDGLPDHIQFQGRSSQASHSSSQGRPVQKKLGGLPSLKPNEDNGRCQRYTGSICAGHLGQGELVFISRDLTQAYIEQKLQAALQVISNSPELSKECSEFAVPAICLSTLPLCDRQTRKPRKVLFIVIFMSIILDAFQ